MIDVRNKFVEKLLNKFKKDSNDAPVGCAGLGFRTGFDLDSHGTGCYAGFDYACDKGMLPFWFLPGYIGHGHNKDLAEREFYTYHAVTHPDSPWQPWLDAMPEQLEGYDTPEDRAKLIAYMGIVYGETAFKTLSLPEMGCFAVFNRRAYEFNGARQSLRMFLEAPETKDLPLRWNVFAANHILSIGGKLHTESWGGGHNNFSASVYPNTAVCYLKAGYTPDPKKSLASGKSPKTFMGGSSDKLFLGVTKKGPDSWQPREQDRYGNDFAEKNTFKNPVLLNKWYWDNKVKPYV